MPTDRVVDAKTSAIVAAIGQKLAVDVADAVVLHQHSNAVIALPSPGWVVRIATAPDALGRITDSVKVTDWLAKRGYPCVVPIEVHQPIIESGRIVSVWRYESIDTTTPPSAGDLGVLLRDLHTQPIPPFPLARFEDPFDDVAAAIIQTPEAMRAAQRKWLLARIAGLRDLWPSLPFSHSWNLIHGDAHLNNLMRTPAGRVILGDWDHTAIGPAEWDLTQIHYTHRRFSRPTLSELDALATAYGWDIRAWGELDTVIAAREITGLSPYIRTAPHRSFTSAELARRLEILHDGDNAAAWTSPPRT